MRAFEVAARCGSFTAAALETGLTQSAISQRIGKLEKLLGTPLFLRQARSITLTVEGEAWLPHVRSAFEGLRESSEGLFGVARKRLSISASSSIIDLWIMPRLKQLSADVGAHLSSGPWFCLKMRRRRTMLYGCGMGRETGRCHIRLRFIENCWRQWSPRISPRRRAAGTVATYRAGGATAWLERMVLRFGTPATPFPQFRFDTFSSALSAARAGLGVMLGSLPLCQADLDAAVATGFRRMSSSPSNLLAIGIERSHLASAMGSNGKGAERHLKPVQRGARQCRTYPNVRSLAERISFSSKSANDLCSSLVSPSTA